MKSSPRVRVSLARKISLLFGVAVLLTISATLVFPWMHMSNLDHQAYLMEAQKMAIAAHQMVDLRTSDWHSAQDVLDQEWSRTAAQFDIAPTPPHLVPVHPDLAGIGPIGGGFHEQCVDYLSLHPDRTYYWRIQDSGKLFRLAMAIRGLKTDEHPDALRGFIDVKLPISPLGHVGLWNVVVTALAGSSGAILAAMVFYLVTRRVVLNPVNTLRQVAERVTSGDIETRAEIQTGDEFQKLAEALNDMLTHLKSAQDDLRKINRSLDVRLAELAEINVALYESNKLKSDFIANVSHELRTPLVSIIGFAELLRDTWQEPGADKHRIARYCENILTSGRSLLELINDLLDLARIEAGKMKLHVSSFSLAELCGDLTDFARPLADKRNLNLELEVEDDLPECRTDSGKIKQVLYNLLSNAIKFTPAGGTVRLAARTVDADRVQLIVSDTGPGIPQLQQERIYEKFSQLDSSHTREFEGTGLGLAITRELVQILEGRIDLESEEGKGTTFVVTLPVQLREPGHVQI